MNTTAAHASASPIKLVTKKMGTLRLETHMLHASVVTYAVAPRADLLIYSCYDRRLDAGLSEPVGDSFSAGDKFFFREAAGNGCLVRVGHCDRNCAGDAGYFAMYED